MFVQEYNAFPNSDLITLTFNYSLAGAMYKKITILRIVTIRDIVMDVIDRGAKITMINVQQAFAEYSCDNTLLSLNGVAYPNPDVATADFQFSPKALGVLSYIVYQNSMMGDNSKMYLILPLVLDIQTSTILSTAKIKVQQPVSTLSYTASEFTLGGSSMQNLLVTSTSSDFTLQMDYISTSSPLSSTFSVDYKYSTTSDFKLQYIFKLITLLYLKTIQS